MRRCPIAARWLLAQATSYIATAPKSNRSGLAYWAAVADVAAKGSLPVPNHLRSATHAEKKNHGLGVGYRYPHDYEGADVDQRYLPEELGERRYYRPTDQGYEATIGTRMQGRLEARETAKASGGPRRSRLPTPDVDPMRVAGNVMKTREGNRAKLAETEERDAAD